MKTVAVPAIVWLEMPTRTIAEGAGAGSSTTTTWTMTKMEMTSEESTGHETDR